MGLKIIGGMFQGGMYQPDFVSKSDFSDVVVTLFPQKKRYSVSVSCTIFNCVIFGKIKKK